MGRYYYFLVASLPSLEFNSKPSILVEEFLQRAGSQLSQSDLASIENIFSGDHLRPEKPAGLLKQWAEFNQGLSNEIAWFRAGELNKDPQKYLRGERGADPRQVDVIAKAAEAADPLAAEKTIDRARWQYLDDLGQGHFFEFENVVIYALKLRMLDRYRVIDSPKGGEIFREYTKINILLN